MPLDGFGRQIDYLRISLLENCNLRCVYCMPMTAAFTPPSNWLTPEEIARVVEAAVRVGFRKFRLTGGEPTLRPDLTEIVARITAIAGADDLSMTTNGVLLPSLAGPLREAGLRRVNIHLDSLNADRLSRVMRLGSVGAILAGIRAAVEAGLAPIKINCVVTRGFNDLDVVDLARLTLEHGWHVRFIELMPTGEGECARVAEASLVRSSETRARIERVLGPLTELVPTAASEESRNFFVAGAPGIIGFISPVSEPYCGACNRLRLTANGRLHLCLLNDDEVDLASAVRAGAGAYELGEMIRDAVAAKPMGHQLDRGRSVKDRQMYQIGG